jgi:hypothetical protein
MTHHGRRRSIDAILLSSLLKESHGLADRQLLARQVRHAPV